MGSRWERTGGALQLTPSLYLAYGSQRTTYSHLPPQKLHKQKHIFDGNCDSTITLPSHEPEPLCIFLDVGIAANKRLETSQKVLVLMQQNEEKKKKKKEQETG